VSSYKLGTTALAHDSLRNTSSVRWQTHVISGNAFHA